MYNPINWKLEHRIALLIATTLGLIVGLLIGIHNDRFLGYYSYAFGICYSTIEWDQQAWRGGLCFHVSPSYWLAMVPWALGGGTICFAAIYIYQLLRT